ncbi:MAG: hypothetical protein U5K00_06275 [Melioribacteraceae bacterium]|nr:hypothetical protein [Melioribacteraceae bacterium]
MKTRIQTFYSYFLIIVFLSHFAPTNLQAQNESNIDSLETLLHQSQDNERLEVLSTLGNSYKYINLDTALIFYKEGLRLAQDRKDKQTEAVILKNIAQTHFFKSDYNAALGYLFSALPIFESLDDTLGQINSNYAIALIYYIRTQYDLSQPYTDTALELAKKSNNREREAAISDLIGDLHFSMDKDYERALELL